MDVQRVGRAQHLHSEYRMAQRLKVLLTVEHYLHVPSQDANNACQKRVHLLHLFASSLLPIMGRPHCPIERNGTTATHSVNLIGLCQTPTMLEPTSGLHRISHKCAPDASILT